MTRLRSLMLAAFAAAGLFATGSDAGAPPRRTFAGHPYHNGNYFIPPSSAYEATRVFPPARYGFPAYYVPSSYLPPGMVMSPFTWYPGVPAGKAGGYYMSAYGSYNAANW
jgi:hypothetical protein